MVNAQTRKPSRSSDTAPKGPHLGHQSGHGHCSLFWAAFGRTGLDDVQIAGKHDQAGTIRRFTYFPEFTLNPTSQESWGFLHPECFGDKALLFFSWDLAKTIEQQFRLHADASLAVQLTEAQKAVDRLLNQYVQIQANPAAFEGQSITLQLEQDDNDADSTPVLALKTSAELEEKILAAQAQMQTSQSVN